MLHCPLAHVLRVRGLMRVRIMIRFKRRSCGQHLSLGAVFLAVLVTPILVVFKLGRHVGWCSPLGAALAFLLWMSGTLKMLELLLGVSEPGALRYSRLVWLVYFCAPTEPIFVDGRPKMLPSRGNTQWHLGWALAKVGVSTLTLRAVVGYAVALPNQDRGGIGGTLLVGVIWCSLITHVLSISQAVVVEHGLVPCGGMRFPLEASHSPTELWGDRMDVAMNRMLKRSVYQPTRRLFGARKTEGRAAATVATFFVSGVLHEVCSTRWQRAPMCMVRTRVGGWVGVGEGRVCTFTSKCHCWYPDVSVSLWAAWTTLPKGVRASHYDDS